MVPMDQPKIALDMINRFMKAVKFNNGATKVGVTVQSPSECSDPSTDLNIISSTQSRRSGIRNRNNNAFQQRKRTLEQSKNDATNTKNEYDPTSAAIIQRSNFTITVADIIPMNHAILLRLKGNIDNIKAIIDKRVSVTDWSVNVQSSGYDAVSESISLRNVVNPRGTRLTKSLGNDTSALIINLVVANLLNGQEYFVSLVPLVDSSKYRPSNTFSVTTGCLSGSASLYSQCCDRGVCRSSAKGTQCYCQPGEYHTMSMLR
jgi:hypothetical protein